MTLAIRPRTTWGARAPRGTTPFTTSRLTHIITHWPGDPRTLAGRDTPALLRAWQNYHMDVRGWRDIGYNYAVDQDGVAWELRGWNVGGHVLADENKISVGLLLIVGNNEPMSDAMRDTAAQLVDWIEEKRGAQLRYLGHCDWANKLCPGPSVLAWTRAGCKPATIQTVPLDITVPTKAGETLPAAPAYPLGKCSGHGRTSYFGPKDGPDHSVSGWYHHQTDGTRGHDGLHRWQKRMAYRGWKITPDGLWGPETERVAQAFQHEAKLPAHGLVGPATWKAAWLHPITAPTAAGATPITEPEPADGVHLRIATINCLSTRFDTRWLDRRNTLATDLTRVGADIICVQEASEAQRDYLRGRLPGGPARWLTWVRGEQAIIWDTNRLAHDTVERVTLASTYHGAVLCRLTDRPTGRRLAVGSAHLQPGKYADDATQRAQLRTILDKFNTMGWPRILAGDLNDKQAASWATGYTTARTAPVTTTSATHDGGGTLDHILGAGVHWRRFEVRPTAGSDHHIVVADVTIPNPTANTL